MAAAAGGQLFAARLRLLVSSPLAYGLSFAASSAGAVAMRRVACAALVLVLRACHAPNPAPATALLVTDVLAFEATKPGSDTRKLFILNQNAEELFGYVWVEAAANISWQAVIGEARTTFANEPANYTVAPGSLVSVDITLASGGLNADVYSVVIKVGGKTINSLHVEVEQRLRRSRSRRTRSRTTRARR